MSIRAINNRIYTFPNEWAIKFVGPVKNYIDFPLSAVCTGVDVDYGGGQPFANMIDGGPSAYTLTVNFTNLSSVPGGSNYSSVAIEDYFLFFAKNTSVNLNRIKGYYANVLFRNDSNKRAELYTVGAEIQKSSK